MNSTGTPSRLRVDGESTMPMTDPLGRILMGATIMLLAGMAFAVPTLDTVLHWMTLFLLLGSAMTVSGIRQALRRLRFRRSIARAELEWPEICADARQAASSGESLARMFQRRGFRDFLVRRWLIGLLHQDGVVSAVPSSSPLPGLDGRRSHGPPDEHTWLQLRDRTTAMMPIANPKWRILLGCLMGIGALGFLGMPGYVFQWTFLFGGLGAGLAFSGLAQLDRERKVRQEVDRARSQWPELLEVASDCDAKALARALQRAGYREYYVRRWLVRRLQAAGASIGGGLS